MGETSPRFPLKRILDHDQITAVTEIFHYDHVTKDVHLEYRQDVTAMLDQNKAIRNDDSFSKNGIKNDMWNYAHIPIIVQLQWLTKYGPENDPMRKGNEKLLFSLLNDREWCHLKLTNKIHLGR